MDDGGSAHGVPQGGAGGDAASQNSDGRRTDWRQAYELERQKRDAAEQRLADAEARLAKAEQTARLAQAEILQEEHRRAMEASLDGIGITDSEGLMRHTNPAQVAMFGYDSPEEIIGRPARSFFTPEAVAVFDAEIAPAIVQHGRWEGETEGIRGDGSTFPLDVSVSQLAHGGLVCVTRDATARKAAEAQKLRITEALYRSQNRESLGKLAGGIAHEFNNILAGILGYANLLAEELPEDSAERRYAREIVTGGGRASSLVQQILAFAGRGDADSQVTDVRVLVDQLAEIMRATLPVNIALHVEPLGVKAPVKGVAQQLRQAIMNLLVNAREAIDSAQGRICLSQRVTDGGTLSPRAGAMGAVKPHGDGSCELALGEADPDRTYYCLRVSDDGCGIASDDLVAIFDPFFTNKGVGEGSGLGLAAVQGIVAAHDGLIRVTSRPGTGTEMMLALPLADAAAGRPAARLTPPAHNARQGKILIADDEGQVANVLRLLIERMGFGTEIVSNGRQALARVREDRDAYSGIISDQTMPEMTGLELLGELHDQGIEIPFVLCTGYSETIDAERARLYGAFAFLNKPIAPPALRDILDRLRAGGDG